MALDNFQNLGNSWQARLPSPYQLRQKYSKFRTECFDNKVPSVEEIVIIWDERIRGAAGYCSFHKKRIRLSPWYHLKYPEDIDATIRHEMIHLLVPNHGPNFHLWLKYLNSNGHTTYRFSKEVAKASWLYTCRNCSEEYPTVRKYKRPENRYCKECGPKLGRLIEEKIEFEE